MERLKRSLRRELARLLEIVARFEWVGILLFSYLTITFFDNTYFGQGINWAWLCAIVVSAILICRLLKKEFYLFVSAFGWTLFQYAFVVKRLAPLMHMLGGGMERITVRLLTSFGFCVRLNDSFIDVLTGTGWMRLSANTGLFTLWNILMVSLLILFLRKRQNTISFLIRLLVGVLFVMPLLGIMSIWLVRDFFEVKMIVSPTVVHIKVFLFALFLSYREQIYPMDGFNLNRNMITICVGLLCVFVAMFAAPVGTPKPIHVLIDNAHGPWEPTDKPMLLEHFGREFTYTYSELVRLLRMYGTVTEWNHGSLSSEVLSSHNIVILKTPSIPFSQNEIAAVEKYVRQGGGLLVLGDHTNLVGMSTILNEVLQPYQIRFEYDDAFDPRTGGFVAWKPMGVDSTPLIDKVPNLTFETSSTVYCNKFFSWDLIVVRQTASEQLRWENPGFFGNIRLDSWEEFGNFSTCVLTSHGMGKVIAFSDSTVLSNFSLFFPGRREILLSWIAMLSSSISSGASIGRVGLSVFGLALVAVAIHGEKKIPEPHILGIVFGASALGFMIVVNLYYCMMPDLQPQATVPNIAFVGNYELKASQHTALSEYTPDFADDYSTFYMASQRLGFTPVWYEDACFDSSALGAVFVNPAVLNNADFLSAARSYLEDGKNVLVLRSRQVVEPAEFVAQRMLGNSITQVDVPVELSSVWSTDGKGRLIIYDNREELAKDLIGRVTAIPVTDDDFRRYDIAFKLLALLGGGE